MPPKKTEALLASDKEAAKKDKPAPKKPKPVDEDPKNDVDETKNKKIPKKPANKKLVKKVVPKKAVQVPAEIKEPDEPKKTVIKIEVNGVKMELALNQGEGLATASAASKVTESKAEVDNKEKPKNKKKTIPKGVRDDSWNHWIGKDKGSHKCLVCNLKDISQNDFECGHIVAESKGGSTTVNNLKPICSKCNKSMGAMNLDEYKNTHYPDACLDKAAIEKKAKAVAAKAKADKVKVDKAKADKATAAKAKAAKAKAAKATADNDKVDKATADKKLTTAEEMEKKIKQLFKKGIFGNFPWQKDDELN